VAEQVFPKSRFDRAIAACLDAGKVQVLIAAFVLTGAIVLADWVTGDLSLGVLYILPMLLVATVIPPRWIVAFAIACSVLRTLLDHTALSKLDVAMRFVFSLAAYLIAGFFVTALIRSRREQGLRAAAEEQLKTLVDSSPAAVLTLDAAGVVLAANAAASGLFGLGKGETMQGRAIQGYLPVLSDALRVDAGIAPFRTAAQSPGRREDGEIFLADTWFSTYPTPNGRRLAAIVIDSSEEMREREEDNLRQLAMNSRIMAGAMLHEVRNLCTAISLVYSNVSVEAPDGNLQALEHLVQGLSLIASSELPTREPEALKIARLQDVLNDLRIIVEPAWAEAGGRIRWDLPEEMPVVQAHTHGLLQVFLNLAQNSLRAVEGRPVQELSIAVTAGSEKTFVRFEDSGCGVADPQSLFRPFRSGANSTGLGLYISRSLLRSYGGELHFDPQEQGAAFVVELASVARRTN
jgi:signal transduction histidine kinase